MSDEIVVRRGKQIILLALRVGGAPSIVATLDGDKCQSLPLFVEETLVLLATVVEPELAQLGVDVDIKPVADGCGLDFGCEITVWQGYVTVSLSGR